MTIHPVPMTWTGSAFEPVRGFAKRCDGQFVVGQRYAVQAEEARSMKSHNRYFAAIVEAWKTLPERLADLYPTAEHLRKRGLIACGYCTIQQVACMSNAEARRVAALAATLDQYCLATVERSICTVAVAESQSMRSMGKQRFQDSVANVEDWIARQLDIDGDTLRRRAA